MTTETQPLDIRTQDLNSRYSYGYIMEYQQTLLNLDTSTGSESTSKQVGIPLNQGAKKLCECGCGKETKVSKYNLKIHNYIKGQPRRFIRGHHSEETKKKISMNMKEQIREGKIKIWSEGLNKETDERIRKRSEKIKGRIPWNKGLTKDINESIKKQADSITGGKRPKEVNNKISKTLRKKWNSGEIVQTGKMKYVSKYLWGKHTQFKKGHKFSKEIEEKRIKNTLKSLIKRPNGYEKLLKQILDRLQPNEWKYVGDVSFLIGYKNPDFINVNGKKICIEVYSNIWKKITFGDVELWKKERKEYVKKYGWDIIYIDDNELKENIIINKINPYLVEEQETISIPAWVRL